MKCIDLIVTAFIGISFALAAPTLENDTIQGLEGNYTIADIKWEIPISDGRTDNVTGTIEDVIRHLEVVAPEIKEVNNTSVPGLEPNETPVRFAGAAVKAATPIKVNCNNLLDPAKKDRIIEGIKYLMKISGKPTLGARSYSRVSCSYNAGIYFCNDNYESITLDNWGMIGDGAGEVTQRCRVDHFGQGYLNGETYYDGGWHVVVQGAVC